MLRNLIEDQNALVFFSEACRYSVDIVNGKDENRREWMSFRRFLESELNLVFLGEKKNNEDSSGKSFGVTAFVDKSTYRWVDEVIPRQLIKEGFGSVALGVNIDSKIYWGVHFPLDFKGSGELNLGAKTMTSLCKVMDEYPGTQFALGDFNTIPGKIESAIREAMDKGGKIFLRDDGTPTFFGAYYDLVPSETRNVVLLIE